MPRQVRKKRAQKVVARKKATTKRPRRIKGRRVEKLIFDNIVKARPRWYCFRFNENRFNATPADLYVGTHSMNVLIEVKATMRGVIPKGNIRKSQREGLEAFQKVNKNNLSLIALYYSRKIVLINITQLDQLKYSIKYDDVKEVGVELKTYKRLFTYFKRLRRYRR